MIRLLRRRVHEAALVSAFLALAGYEAFEWLALEAPGRASPLAAGLIHAVQVAVVFAVTWAALRAWREKTAREAALARMVEKVVFAQEEERRRIAYELHDGVAQLIVSAKQHLDTCEGVVAREPARAAREMATGIDRLDRAIVETRRVALALQPSRLDALGLAEAARSLVRDAAQEGGFTATFRERLGSARVPPALETAIFRILQEALGNVLRHARASRVEVDLRREAGWLALDVQDHGAGIATLRRRGLGLESMRERARLLGGSCVVESEPARGTAVRVRLPLAEAPAGG